MAGAARFNNTVVIDGELAAQDNAELKKDLRVGEGIVAKRAILNESLLVEGSQNVQGTLTVGAQAVPSQLLVFGDQELNGALAVTGPARMATINSAQNLDIDSVGALSMNASGGPILIGDDAVSQDINVGTGAVPREITIGNQAGESSIRLNSGTGGVQLQSARDVVVSHKTRSNSQHKPRSMMLFA